MTIALRLTRARPAPKVHGVNHWSELLGQRAHHRLAEDHANARLLAEGLSQVEGIEVDLDSVQTNIIVFQTPGTSAAALSEALEKEGVGMLDFGPEALRAVANLMVSREQIQQVPEKMAKALKSLR